MSADTAKTFSFILIGYVIGHEVQRQDWASVALLVAAVGLSLLAVWLEWRKRWGR